MERWKVNPFTGRPNAAGLQNQMIPSDVLCDDLAHKYRDFHRRFIKSETRGTQKYTPHAALRASPDVIERLRAFKYDKPKKSLPKDDEVEIEVNQKKIKT